MYVNMPKDQWMLTKDVQFCLYLACLQWMIKIKLYFWVEHLIVSDLITWVQLECEMNTHKQTWSDKLAVPYTLVVFQLYYIILTALYNIFMSLLKKYV